MSPMETFDEKSEIEKWIEENPLVKALLERSSLKEGELKALLLYFSGEEITFRDLSSKLGINRSGAWKRWKRGYSRITESFYTLELAIYGGVLDPEVARLIIEDLQDYLKLAHEEGDMEALRHRLERRIAEMEELGT